MTMYHSINMIQNMRRHIYIILMLLGCMTQLRAQDTVRIVGYEYWFDDNFDARVKVDTVGEVGSTLWLEDKRIDASGLGEGIHQLFMRAKNSKNLWSNIEISNFYIDRDPETRPALKEVRRYRYMFSDGTMKYGEVGNPSLSITDKVIAEAPSPTNIFIDKNATTFTFPNAAQEKSEVTMTRELEYCFALQYENDQNGWCPPVVTNFTRQQTLTKDAHWLDTGMECSFLQPHRGNFEVVAFEILEKGNYAIKSSDGVFTALYKKATDGDNAEWVNFAEVSPSELAEGYREYYDAGSYFGVIYTPEKYEDGQEESLRINLNLMTVCDKPEIIVNGNMVTIGGIDYDVTYYYTTDGTEPTTSSQQYTAPFTISSTCVVKAIAVRDGSCDSDLAVAYVKIGGDEDKPNETERVEARFDEGVLTLTCPTENAVIYYGISQEPQRVYSAPLQLTDNRPVYFYAQAPGYEASGRDSMEISYFRCKISAYSDRYIRLKCDDDECTIHWMQDSDEPSNRWTTQTGPLVNIWNSYTETYKTVRAFASSPYKLNSDTITFDPDAIYQYPDSYTYVNKPGTLSTAYEWLKDYNGSDKDDHARMIKVDGVINHDDLNYIKQMPNLQFIDLSRCEVVEKTLPDSIFAGMNIRFFRSPANLTSCGKGILAGCKRIGGVEWNSRIRVPDDILGGVDYPNLLLYVNSAAYANANLFHNLVTNGVSTNITLKDAEENGCFFAIAGFWAKKISYTRNFKMTTSLTGESQGWETITLPFEVKKVTHETNGSCAPFGYDAGTTDVTYKNFWLSEIVADKFANSSVFPKISYQYIVSMPNNVEYSDECILGGNVTFSASDAWVESTNVFRREGGSDWYANFGYGNVERYDYVDYDSIRIYSNYEYLEPSEERSTINVGEAYGEYNPGSVFVPGVFGCKPFEAYIEYEQKEADGAPRRGPVVAIGENTTGIKSIPARYADDEVYSDGGKLYIYSDVEKDMPLYNVTGQLVKVVRLHVGENVVEGLHSGTYIVKGKKFMINYRR